jgi:DNA-binding response OmpR family regulator
LVLVVGATPRARARTVASMQLHGFRCAEAATPVEAIAELRDNHPDLVLVDPDLPGAAGDDVLTEIRGATSAPMIVLSSAAGEAHLLRALRLGADDYLATPFGQRELIARVDAAIRRAEDHFGGAREIRCGDLVIDLASREVSVRGSVAELTAKEFDLLAFLAAAPGVVFTRRQLLHDVWDSSPDWQGAGTVTEHIRRLRRLIEVDPKHPSYLRTIRSVGYRFDPPLTSQVA